MFGELGLKMRSAGSVLGSPGSGLSLINRTFCNGRLTLTTADPIGADTTGSTLYFTPINGNLIGLHDGSSQWNLIPFVETSIAVPGSTGVYDIFAYNNSGTMVLETSTAWSTTGNNTAAAGGRAVGLVMQDGVYVKSGAPTRRYLGTVYSVSGTATDNTSIRGVWNYYNRIQKKLYVSVAGSWTYTSSGTWRPLNNSSTSNFSLVVGVKQAPISLLTSVNVQAPDGNNSGAVGVGYDSSTTPVSELHGITGFVAAFRANTWGSATHQTDIGLHTYYGIEIVINVGGTISMNFYGTAATYDGAGMTGLVYC